MRITALRENLKKALNLTSRAVGGNVTLPVLSNLLLKTESGQLKIASTNLEIAIKTWVGGKIEKPGEITVSAKTINDFVNSVSDEKITLESKGGDLTIKTQQSQALLKGIPADEFPLIPEIKNQKGLEVPAKNLVEALTQVSFATTFSETQPELSGVLFQTTGKNLVIAATDRYRLAEKKIKLENQKEDFYFIVPSRAVAEITKAVSEKDKNIKIFLSDNQALFKTEDAEIITRVIEGRFPDYQQIIPSEFNTEIKLNTQELSTAVKLSGLFAQDNNNIDLEINTKESSVIITSASQKSGENKTSVKGEIKGQQNKIVFNYRYILDCLNHISSPEVLLKVIDSGSPAMIIPKGEENYLYLVMPIKT